jgi:hypothetical protein
MELTNSDSIKTYNKILEIRKFLKGCQQLSWDTNSVDKRYPLDQVPESSLPDILDTYENLRDRLVQLALGANDSEPF